MPRTKRQRNAELQPYFPGSVIRNLNPCRAPLGYESVQLTPELSALISREALGVFTDTANQGHSFERCLSSVMLTGMAYAAGAISESETAQKP